MLTAHVLAGLVGVAGFYAAWLYLSKKESSLPAVRAWLAAAAAAIIGSWLTGGYYYVLYYGGAVKPVIKKSAFPWAHTVFTEAKEHVFLFLPFIALALFAVSFFAGPEMIKNEKLKRAVGFAAFAATLVGVAVTLSGVIMSGAVRK